jgi:hypothetical protein
VSSAIVVKSVKNKFEVCKLQFYPHLFQGKHEFLELKLSTEVLVNSSECSPKVPILLLNSSMNNFEDLFYSFIQKFSCLLFS